MKRDNQDNIGDCCFRDDQGNVALSDDAKKAAWKEHYEHLLNVEFPWSAYDLTPADPIPGPLYTHNPWDAGWCSCKDAAW